MNTIAPSNDNEEKILILSDLDGTLLEGGVLGEENQKLVEKLESEWIFIVPSTGKGIPRVHEKFSQCPSQILENGAKIIHNGQIIEKNITGKSLEKTLNLLESIKDKINFLFFYNAKAGDKAFFYKNGEDSISPEWRKKFDNIWNDNRVHDLGELEGNILEGKHNMGLLNINVDTKSIEELGIKTDVSGLNLVFNEGMLNISVSDKGKAVQLLLENISEKIDRILVAGNDQNDLPMIQKVIELTRGTKVDVGIIIVGDKLEQEKKYLGKSSSLIQIESPDKWHEGVKIFLNN